MDKFKKGGNKFNSNLAATNRLFAKNPLLKKRRKKAPGIYDPNAKYKFEEGGALLTKKVTCKKCGWTWDAADGGDDVTTCHKCNGQGLVHAKQGGAYYDDSRDAWVYADGTVGPNGPAYADGGEYFEMDLTPEEIEEYAKGGFIVEDISVPELNQMDEGGAACPQGYIRVHGKCVPIHNMVNNRVDPYYTSNPYDPRIKAFKDSLDLYNGNAGDYKILRENNMIPHIANNSELNKGQKKYIKSAKIKPKYYVKGDRTSKTPAGYMSHMFPVFAPPRQEVIYKPKPKPKKQVVKKVEEKPIIKEQVVVEEPMQMMPIQPVTKVDTPLQKFIGTVPTTIETEVMPTDETVEDVGYTEGGPDGPNVDWVDHTQRYIDWDGNSIGFNGIRFRKPGHGGDLIKKGRRHYLHYPSIESRYQAELVPEETEEEYAFGGEYNEGDEVELTEAEVQRLRSLGYIIEEV